MKEVFSTLLTIFLLLAMQSLRAQDGAFEISPLCVATGCFAGDDPGFPVQVRRPGRYVFTGNLDVTGEPTPEDVTAIQVVPLGANVDVTIDLNGYEIRGPVTCTGTPVTSCSIGVGTGDGIRVVSTSRATIRNGSIFGMGDDGIDCSGSNSSCRIENMLIQQNLEHGLISAGPVGTSVAHSVVRNNRANGIQMVDGSVIDVTVLGNGGNGVAASTATLDRILASLNGLDGISSSGVVRNSTSNNNGSCGIYCFGCQAIDNRASFNGVYGIDLLNSALYGRNRFSNNTLADARGTGGGSGNVVIAPNWCLDSTCL